MAVMRHAIIGTMTGAMTTVATIAAGVATTRIAITTNAVTIARVTSAAELQFEATTGRACTGIHTAARTIPRVCNTPLPLTATT